MAQQKRRLGKSLHLLARRYGVSSTPVMVGACVAMLLAVAMVAHVASGPAQGELVIERNGSSSQNATATTKERASADNNATAIAALQEPQRVVVHVDGAVEHPGVYEVRSGSPRVMDAVELAGGLTSEAVTDSVNLAAQLADGTKVHIPRAGEETTPAAAEEAPAQVMTTEGVDATQSDGLVNINTANAEELKTLSGVGDATAAAIIEEREQNGPFASPEDLMRVSGIGEKKYAKIQDAICV